LKGVFKMETYTSIKPFVDDPHFFKRRQDCLSGLDIGVVDAPMIAIINGFLKLPYCFTLQSCYGHFVYDNQRSPQNIKPLPTMEANAKIKYRIAYLALCLQNNDRGKELLETLEDLVNIDREYIQVGCAEWFRKRQVNSYVIQVEPERYKTKDMVVIRYPEALQIEKVRNQLYNNIIA